MATSDAPDAPAAERIITRIIEDEMKSSYLDYAMSVIIGRALPDLRDGLKPVHRRILYAMHDMGIKPGTAHKKCARIVGEVLGKYHPHGDSAVYDALVRMAQDFSMRHLLVDGHGNFGSIDGDNAAAMRYTEARMARIAEELLRDIEKETVDFADNFDGTLKEPLVLPCAYPNLLVNGSSGIAVGMATSIPPHNLREVCAATAAMIDNPELDARELLEHLPGPDFPTGATIAGRSGIAQAYATGRGRVIVKSVIDEEEHKDRARLVVSELPYMVNKAELLEHIAHCVNAGTIEGIADLRDESNREGMRVVIDLKRGANVEVVRNQLFKHTRLQTTFSMTLLSIDNAQPRIHPLPIIIRRFIDHRIEVITRRTQYDLAKAKERAHILEGLTTALKHIDAIIVLLKKATNADVARQALIDRYELSEKQANAILEMRLQRLTGLEQQKIRDELAQIRIRIAELEAILASDARIRQIIKNELAHVAERYGDDRRTEIIEEEGDLEIEDLITPEEMVVTLTHAGYAKRTPLELYKLQRRGGVGIRATEAREEDFVEHLFIANTHDSLLVFTTGGIVHWLKVYQLPAGSRYSKGKAIVNLLRLKSGERVASIIPIKDFNSGRYLIMATEQGLVKKTELEAYSRPRQGGIIGCGLREGDRLVRVLPTEGDAQVMLATAKGKAVKFCERDVRAMGRSATGVRGVLLEGDDRVVGMIMPPDDHDVLTVTEHGYGKRSSVADYRLITRGGKGVRNIITNARNGRVAAILDVTPEHEVMLISRNGTIIRTAASGISRMGRATQGVRVMNLREGDVLTSAATLAGNGVDDEKGEDL